MNDKARILWKTVFPTRILNGVTLINRDTAIREGFVLWPDQDYHAIDFLPLLNSEGLLREVAAPRDFEVYLPYEWPSIQCSHYKLVWMIYNDANWDGIDCARLFTLDLSTLKFYLQDADDDGFIIDRIQETGINDIGNSTENKLILDNTGTRCIFYLEGGDMPMTDASILMSWRAGRWDIERVLQCVPEECFFSESFQPEVVDESEIKRIQMNKYQCVSSSKPQVISQVPENDKWKILYYEELAYKGRI